MDHRLAPEELRSMPDTKKPYALTQEHSAGINITGTQPDQEMGQEETQKILEKSA